VSETQIRWSRSNPFPSAYPPLVILVGRDARDHRRVDELLDSGSFVLLVPTAETMAASLPADIFQRDEAEVPHVLIRANKLEIDLTERRAWWSGQLLDLTEYELKLLACLAEDPKRAWRFAELLSKVWGVESYGQWDVVHAVIRRLRKKLAEAGTDLTIDSVRGVGFRLAAPSGLQRIMRATGLRGRKKS
jgi:DNA-binding response OmpR family regulator